jgi:prevent-host-death family protein
MDRVGVRELRQRASALLERVMQGETIEISNHGRPVAQLTPLAAPRPGRDELIAAGVLRPGHGDPLDVEPVVAPAGTTSVADLLEQMHDER